MDAMLDGEAVYCGFAGVAEFQRRHSCAKWRKRAMSALMLDAFESSPRFHGHIAGDMLIDINE